MDFNRKKPNPQNGFHPYIEENVVRIAKDRRNRLLSILHNRKNRI